MDNSCSSGCFTACGMRGCFHNNKKEKIRRHKFGEYKNVLLSEEDVEKLKKEFPTDWVARIENLSSYIASTGKVYKNHLATIRNWARKETPKETKPKVAFDESKYTL